MTKEASSVLMEISDEEGKQIDGGKRSYGRGDCSKVLEAVTTKEVLEKTQIPWQSVHSK